MVSINIFGCNDNSLYDINQDLDLNNNALHNLKDPEGALDAANRRYVDSKLIPSTIHNEKGEFMGNLTLEADKEFGIFFGSDKNLISWKKRSTQFLKFTAEAGFVFYIGVNPILIISSTGGLKAQKNINLGNNCRIINSKPPISDTDCVTKSYCDAKLLKNGDTMLGNLYFDGSTRNINLGCINLGVDNYFSLYLGSGDDRINFKKNVLDLAVGRIITVNIGSEMNIVVIDSGGITISKPLFMNDRNITGLAHPVEARDAVTKHYVDDKFDELFARLQQLESNFR